MLTARLIYSQEVKSVTKQNSVTISPTSSAPTAIPSVIPEQKDAKPVALSIDDLNIFEEKVEYVGLDAEGKMDAPKNPDNVAWFELGYRPGEQGSAVIAGHFDKVTGEPAVFYYLNSLGIGRRIRVKNSDGSEKIFQVVDKKLYPENRFPTEKVFGPSDKKMLNLITCDGTWDSVKKSYSNRLVIYSELINK